MFRKNQGQQQIGLFETVEQLPEKHRLLLERSWAGTFYRELFSRIDESLFAGLYSTKASRPNTPVNVLVGMEVLKAGFGWSDEELYREFVFNLQVRYALGLRDLASGNFELRTLYNFRQRLSQHMQQNGENLLERVFAQVTGAQLAAFGLHSAEQRMDATYIASNIRQMSRLQLLVEVVQRVWRMLDAADRATYAAVMAPYQEGSTGQFIHRVRKDAVAPQLQALGALLQRLVSELASKYAQQPAYQVLAQVLAEHFTVQSAEGAPQVHLKPPAEMAAASLQSPDDREATYSHAGGVGHRGYKANVSETCAPENPFQLITSVQVAPNVVGDQQLLQEAVPDLQQRTGLQTLWTDGGFTGQQASAVVRQQGIRQIPTGVRGGGLANDRIAWDAFTWEVDNEGKAHTVTCPEGQRVPVVPGVPERCRAHFAAERCRACPQVAHCRAKPADSGRRYTMYLTYRAVQVALTRQVSHTTHGPGRNRRAAVESTIRSLKHPFGGQKGKLPVRGRIRVTMVMVAAALMVNLRRIWRLGDQMRPKPAPKRLPGRPAHPIWLVAPSGVRPWLQLRSATFRLHGIPSPRALLVQN